MPESQTQSRLADYGLLALFVALAYWPLSSFQHITRWDSIQCALPPRWFLSDCVRHGCWPFWNPYTFNGSPFYGDPQSGAWYPLAWLIGGVAPYGFSSFIIEHLLIFFIAASGMYELTRSFGTMRGAALMAGFAYCASGFFVGNAEHFTWLIAAAWLPWVFWSYHRMTHGGAPGYALLTALFLFLMFTGGYPAFFVTAAYMLCLFFIVALPARKRAGKALAWLRLHLYTLGIFAALSAGFIISLSQVLPQITRIDALDMRHLLGSPFTPHSFVSLLLPFSTLNDDAFFGTDISMRNIYVGLMPLLLLPFAWPALRRKKILWLVAVLSLFCLAAALGPSTPVRRLLAACLPLMDHFQYPGFFRVFAIIGLLLLSAMGYSSLARSGGNARARLSLAIGLLAAIFAAVLLRSLALHGWLWGWGRWAKDFEPHLTEATRPELIQLQAMLQLALLMMLLSFLLLKKSSMSLRPLVFFAAADLVLATSLNAFGTVVYPEFAREIERPVAQAPRGFPVPDNEVAVWNNRDGARDMGQLSSNAGIFLKMPSPNGYNPAQLKTFDRLERSAIREAVWSNPYLYFATGVSAAPDSTPLANAAELRVDTADYAALRDMHGSIGSIHVRRFAPGIVQADVTLQEAGLLNLQQCIFAGWHCYVDGHEARLIRTNYAQMAVVVPAGRHDVQWVFRPRPAKLFMVITALMLVALLLCIVCWRKKLFQECPHVTEG